MNSEVRFGDLAELRKETVNPLDMPELPYVGLEHIEPGSLHLSSWGVSSDVKSQKLKFYSGDILFGKLRPYFRKVATAPFDGICSTDIWVVNGVDPRDNEFLKYWMASDAFIRSSTDASEGSSLPRAQWDWVSKFVSPITNGSARRSIGRTLGILDEKIALNLVTSETLEKIAQTIFKSWFIDFDPVHARARGEQPAGMDAETAALFPDSFEESSQLGTIPAGWTVLPIGSVVQKLTVGKIHSAKSASKSGHVPILDQKGPGFFGFHDGRPGVDASPESPVVVFGNHSCKIRLVDHPFSVIQNVFALSAGASSPYWLYFAVSGKQDYEGYKGHWPEFVLHKIVQPDTAVTRVFGKLVEPLFQCASSLRNQNSFLTEIRDLLLPPLISGELEIPQELLVD
jgi:type I restriction enzyme, S subunit